MQDDLEPKFLFQAQDRYDVIVPVSVVVHDLSSLEHVNESLHGEVAVRGVIPACGNLVSILLGLDELFADQCR